MRVNARRILFPILMFGFLFGISSTAKADALSFTTFSFNQIKFTSSSGTAVFTMTAFTTRAVASNSLGAIQDISADPIPQSNASVQFASASGGVISPNFGVGSSTTADPRGDVTSGAFAVGEITGTLVVNGAEGAVDVTLSAIQTFLQHVETDEFGGMAESDILFNVFLNGIPIFSLQVERTVNATGANLLTHIESLEQISRTFSVQAGTTNTIVIRASTNSIANSEVPEPATVLLLVSGLGAMTGVLKKKRKNV